jgi:hypothetical protein
VKFVVFRPTKVKFPQLQAVLRGGDERLRQAGREARVQSLSQTFESLRRTTSSAQNGAEGPVLCGRCGATGDSSPTERKTPPTCRVGPPIEVNLSVFPQDELYFQLFYTLRGNLLNP